MTRANSEVRILYICGSVNQTSQLDQVARELGPHSACFTPYYTGPGLAWARRLGLLEGTIGGNKRRRRCLEYLHDRGRAVDLDGARGGYDLVVTSSDVVIQPNIAGYPVVAVQEGILDPHTFLVEWIRRVPFLPRWLAGTAATGLSGAYRRFCVASEGYRDHFVRMGADPARVVATGIPNFDDCESFRNNSFSLHHYVLVCTSDARETFKLDARRTFIRRAVWIAAGRPLYFKLHPNENVERARAEIHRWAPGARVFWDVPVEPLVANCDVLVVQYSTLAFVGLALGKEVHSYYPLDELRRLLPIQNGCAARNIAAVCREVLAEAAPERFSRWEVAA